MNWKHYLKPTISKLILIAIIFTLFVPFISYDNGIRCITTPCPNESTGSVAAWLIFSPNFHIYSVNYINLVIGLILLVIFYKLFNKIVRN